MGIFPNPFISGLVTDRVYTLPIYLTINLKAYTCTRVYPATREIIMSAYIIFTESVIYFTPNSTTLNSHGHVAIKVVTPRPFLHKHQYNTDTGRHEIAVHIPINYGEKFWVFVYLDKHPRQRIRSCTCLEVYPENGIITDIIPIGERHPEKLNSAGVNIKFPSGEYTTSEYEWHKYPRHAPANSWFIWLP